MIIQPAQDNGRKRHIAVDTCGLLLAILVTGASVQDRDGARPLLWALQTCFPQHPAGLGRLRLRRSTGTVKKTALAQKR
jgi:hypothetical protein